MHISTFFLNQNRNKLKNIFFLIFKDQFFWTELEKLFNLNFIGFTLDFLYGKNTFLRTNFLSMILFEIYLFDFDCFLIDLSLSFSSLKNIFSVFGYNQNSFTGVFFFNSISLLFDKSTASLLNSKIYTFRTFNVNESSIFVKKFFANRYKDHLLLSFISSHKFSSFVKTKILSFLRSVIGFDLRKFYFTDQSFHFLGYKICCSYIDSSFLFTSFFFKPASLRSNKKLFFRLNTYKKKFFTHFLNRIRFELISTFDRVSSFNKIFIFDNLGNKFWSYFFQLECSRSFRYGALLFSDDV